MHTGYFRSIMFIFLLTGFLSDLNCQYCADSLINLATRKIEAGDLDDAMKDFELVLTIHPDNKAALDSRIRILFLEGNLREATSEINRLIELYPEYPGFYLTRGIIQNQRRSWQPAIKNFNRALELETSNVSVIYLHRGISKMNLNNYQSAIEDFSLAIEYDPLNIAAYNYRGMVNYRENRYESAIEDFNIIIQIIPENEVVRYNRAMAFLKAGYWFLACMDFHQSCRFGNMNGCRMIIMECQLGSQPDR